MRQNGCTDKKPGAEAAADASRLFTLSDSLKQVPGHRNDRIKATLARECVSASPTPELVIELRDLLHAMGSIAAQVAPDMLRVAVPDAPPNTEPQRGFMLWVQFGVRPVPTRLLREANRALAILRVADQ
jgi:hypothetical protein